MGSDMGRGARTRHAWTHHVEVTLESDLVGFQELPLGQAPPDVMPTRIEP